MAADGAAGGEPLLAGLLGGMSGELYRSLFAFGLGELQELRTLQADEVASYLYGAGFGAGGAALRDAEKRLQQRMDELYRPRGRIQPIAATLKAMDELETALRRSGEELPRYEALRRELESLDAALAQLAEGGAAARRQAERLAQCLRARPTWLELRALAREEAELPVFQAFPEAAVSRWETLAAERERLLRSGSVCSCAAAGSRSGWRRKRCRRRTWPLGQLCCSCSSALRSLSKASASRCSWMASAASSGSGWPACCASWEPAGTKRRCAQARSR
ncbi:hypothetical protein SD70_27670 [Gordoniibacillus kamchatkensis]|uniref:YhaN AAA domain-containing protein n=2 Tax=Gordoniibacillus kamchatkensis TaxID=1590651 RepID=A0ABR5ABB2_9BACL|nr:hypothetical protein SD70_27670 [Paenibacillus sp. VKM B-2647]